MSRNDTVTVMVKGPGTKVNMRNCSPSEQVEFIKQKLADEYKIPKQHQRLILAGTQLSSGRTLGDYRISEVIYLYLVFAMRWGRR
jgi:hypothetical protein